MADEWAAKELLEAVKMNELGVPKYTDAEEIAIIDGSRLAGMINYNTTNKTVHVYQSGLSSTFDITELTNFLFRNKVNMGITTPQQIAYDESFVNTKGKMNTSLFVSLQYLQETSIAGQIEIIVTDGTTPVTDTITLTSNGSPTVQYITSILDTSAFAIDVILQVTVSLLQVQTEFVEMRSI